MQGTPSIPRSLLTALWLGIAALVLQGFGAALHACSHAHPNEPSIFEPVGHQHAHASHTCSHTHHAHPSPDEAPIPEPNDTTPSQDDHDPNGTPERHNDCLTCLKLASNAREILSPHVHIAHAPPLLAPSVKHPAPGIRSRIADPNLPARGPPTLIIA